MSVTVTAVIPTWNRIGLLATVLTNLETQTRPPDRILVIDNGSTDGSATLARHRGADVIAFQENRGFAVAVNEGIRQSQSDYIFIVNNDVILKPDWLERILTTAREDDPALFFCGKLLRPGNAEPHFIDGSWDLVSRGVYAWRCGYGKPDGPVWSTRRRIQWAPMTAAVFNKTVFERVGLLDTRLESYYEDVEFGIRCALAGVVGVYEPAAVATHMSKTTLGRSSSRVYFYTARNQVHILAAYFGSTTLRRFAWPILVGQTLALFAAARQRNFLAAVRGKWAGLQAWKSFRRVLSVEEQERIGSIFEASEREIHRLQAETGFDLYWRLYFMFVKCLRAKGRTITVF